MKCFSQVRPKVVLFARQQKNDCGMEEEETCRKMTDKNSMAVRERNSGAQSGKPKPNEGKPDMKCWRCHGIGHFRRAYPNSKRNRATSQTQPLVGRHTGGPFGRDTVL